MESLRNERLVVAIAVFCVISMAAAAGFLRSQPAAQRWCTNSCQAAIGCNLDFSDGVARKLGENCFIRQNQCNQICGYEPEPDKRIWKVVVPPGPWGAIAYDSKTGSWGLADSAPDPEIARYSAYVFCNRYSNNCVVMDTFRDTCIAVASAPDNTVTWAKDADIKAATDNALARCNTQSNTHACIFRHATCYPDNSGKRQKED